MSRKLLNLCLAMLLSVVSTAAWALSEENGFYRIGSAEDYAEFAALVNGGQRSANAILTADIDLATDIDTYKIYNGEYVGVFDGAGHTITLNWADGTKDNQGPALFRSLNRLAVVKRLKVQGTLTTERQHSAAIANYSSGTGIRCICRCQRRRQYQCRRCTASPDYHGRSVSKASLNPFPCLRKGDA